MLKRQNFLRAISLLPVRYDPSVSEPKWQAYWKKPEVYKAAFAFDPSGKPYVIDTPPPFTSGEPHMGTVYFTIIVDTLARYKRARGYSVLLPQGWDTHGLPTELRVQYDLKVDKSNVSRFRKACRDFTRTTIESIKSGMIAVGYRPDWEAYEYTTDDPDYIKAVQLSLILMYKAGLVYRKKFPVYWCPHCGTVVSQAEVGYVEREGVLAYVRFRGADGSPGLVVATTRPELLYACVGVFVSPKDDRYSSMVGKEVKVPLGGWTVKVMADDAVDMSFGTGAVMVATFGDEQDIRWQLKYSLPIRQVVDQDGRMKDAGELTGLKLTEARKKALDILKEVGLLERLVPIRHNVLSHTERQSCMNPVEFIPLDQLMIKMSFMKDIVMRGAEGMAWHPALMLERVRAWHDSLEWDWVISRQRVFGTPLPFWVCADCGELIPAKEADLPVDPSVQSPPVPACPACGSKNLIGVKDVADGWVDSSITPLWITGFFKNKELFEKLYPVDVRQQGYEIIRTWFWYSAFRGIALTGRPPFKSVLVNGMILAPDGKPMSKSRGNVINPLDAVRQYGADPLRYGLLSLTVGADFPFRWEAVKRGRALLQKIWSAYRLVSSLPVVPVEEPPSVGSPLDHWILQRLAETEVSYTKAMDDFRFNEALDAFVQFFWHDLCDDYLESAKPRASQGDPDVMKTLGFVFRSSLSLFAPFLPHLAEEIYQDLGWGKEPSVHAVPWPQQPAYSTVMAKRGGSLLTLISRVRSAKVAHGFSLGQRVSWAELSFDEDVDPAELSHLISDVLRIDQVKVRKGPFSVEFGPGEQRSKPRAYG